MVPRAPNAEWAPEFLGVSAARGPLGLALTTIKSDDWTLVRLPLMDT